MVLDDIRHFLLYPHKVQELVSGEKTPTLSVVLPAYEELLSALRSASTSGRLIRLQKAVNVSIEKLETYLHKARRNPVYVLAMALNPMYKLEWMRNNWSAEDYQAARTTLRDALLEYQQERQDEEATRRAARQATSASTVPARASSSASRLTAGMGGFRAFVREQSGPNNGSPAAAAIAASTTTPPITSEQRLQRNLAVVDAAIAKYEAEGLYGVALPTEGDEDGSDGESEGKREDELDLCSFWSDKKSENPLFYRLAQDVLPAQASSVPSERVFSSGKETDTLRRNSLSPYMMEFLQVLKFKYRSERVSFADGWISSAADLDRYDDGELEEMRVRVLQNHDRVDALSKLIVETLTIADSSNAVQHVTDEDDSLGWEDVEEGADVFH
ncbi:hypothetical protein PENSPDRAFT_602738 [Peniophora sp. CONT]|nr:hypothetical protein PENSPDRAFT_602738 [Peniophora sp. CONT]